MARKSIKGYAEKNYYDNTRFNGGILTSGDPLNEGYFNHLVNFDINDTGQSLVPRKGFFTTTFMYNGNPIIFNKNSTVYFFDANIGKYIFIDFSQKFNGNLYAFKTTMDIVDKDIPDISLIDNIDFINIPDIISNNMANIRLHKNKAYPIIDEYSITKYIVRAELQTIEGKYVPYWLTFNYREKRNIQYITDNTLSISYLNTEDAVNYLESKDRNIASGEDWIPLDMQEQYSSDNVPEGHIDRLDRLYTKQGDEYLINNIRSSDLPGLEIIPNFYVADVDDNYEWVYTYDITSTSRTNYWTSTPYIHKGFVYRLADNTKTDIENYLEDTFLPGYYNAYDAKASKYNDIDDIKNESKQLYEEFIKSLSFDSLGVYPDSHKYLLYAVPDPTNLEGNIELDILEALKPEVGFLTYKSPVRDMFSTHYLTLPEIEGELNPNLDYIVRDTNTRNDNITNTSIFYNANTLFKNYDPSCIGTDMHATLMYLNNNGFKFYKIPIENLTDYSTNNYKGFQEYMQTAFTNRLFTIPKTAELLTAESVIHSINLADKYFLKIYTTVSPVQLNSTNITTSADEHKEFLKLFSPNDDNPYYYIYTDLYTSKPEAMYLVINESDLKEPLAAGTEIERRLSESEDSFSSLFKIYTTHVSSTNTTYIAKTLVPILPPSSTSINIQALDASHVYRESESLFSRTDPDAPLIARMIESNSTYNALKAQGFFSQGITLTFYLMYVPKKEYYTNHLIFDFKYTRDVFVTHAYIQSCQLVTTLQEPTTIVVKLEDEPKDIAYPKDYLVFNSSLGDHLVVYVENKVYISKESMPYYFRFDYMHSFPETVIKVIQYKDTLLVFTKHDLYSIYLYETVNLIENGVDEEGNIQYAQQTVYNFAKLPVLYNLMVDEKYKDAIQVYNQMVLFYSSDGQLFLIKPTAAIDSNTRFSIQFINKAANDILLNYKKYMQSRLDTYMLEHPECLYAPVDDVIIKVQVSINFIKIYYIAPNVMTYVLIYDILNNRFTVYDTLEFHDIIEVYDDFIISSNRDKMYITTQYTIPYETNTNVDMSIYNNFNPTSIYCELDTGVLNLNNHLKKRFKELQIQYKNISSTNVKFNLNTFVDDVPIKPLINTYLEVRNISSFDTLVVLDDTDVVEILDDNTALFNFLDYSSNKIITQKNSIVSKGKNIRFVLHFKSKGKYKVQGYGIIYKEHTV